MTEFRESHSPLHQDKKAEEMTDVELTTDRASKAKARSNSCNQQEIDALMEKIRAYNNLEHTPLYEKISERTLQSLDEQEVDEDKLLQFGDADWASLAITIGQRKNLQTWISRQDEEMVIANKELYYIFPADPKLILKSTFMGIFMFLPALIIGLLMDEDKPDEPDDMFHGFYDDDGDYGWKSTAFFYMGIPGTIFFIIQQVIAFKGRASLGLDMIEEASPGKDVGETAAASLTNNAVVAALLLTVAIAMTQADAPQENPTRMLSQWYLYFSTTSSIFCLQSTLRSVLLMIYVEPLDAQASFMFICQYLDYFGEPAVVMVLACGNMLCALILWIFGVYGRAAGLVGIICCFYSVQQAILTFFYVSSFKNPLGYHPDSRYKAAVDTFLGKEYPGGRTPEYFARLKEGIKDAHLYRPE